MPHNNPYPVESALLAFENGLKGEATRSLFETARMYQEGMFVYGSKMSYEWGFRDIGKPYITTLTESRNGRGRETNMAIINVPNTYEMLHEEIRHFTVGGNYDPLNPQDSPKAGAAYPHLVHEFMTSIIEDRKPWIDEVLGGNITAAGIYAHESAMQDGKEITVPVF